MYDDLWLVVAASSEFAWICEYLQHSFLSQKSVGDCWHQHQLRGGMHGAMPASQKMPKARKQRSVKRCRKHLTLRTSQNISELIFTSVCPYSQSISIYFCWGYGESLHMSQYCQQHHRGEDPWNSQLRDDNWRMGSSDPSFRLSNGISRL